MSDRLYRVIMTIVLCILAAGIAWVSASRYTFETIKVWKSDREIATMDYFGNIMYHWFDEEEE